MHLEMKHAITYIDDKGRIQIPRNLRNKVKSKAFTIKISKNGTIILQPIKTKTQKLAGKYKNLLQNKSYKELEETQEKFIQKKRGI